MTRISTENGSLPDVTGDRAGDRSPNYPVIGLDTALSRVRAVYDAERRNWAPVSSLYAHWGYSATSSGGRQVLAALNSYGLLEFQGSGPNREARVSPRALKWLTDLPDKEAALREAALAPRLHKELWDKYSQGGLPSDQTLRAYLIEQRRFNPDTVESFIQQFRATLAFAKVQEGAILDAKPSPTPAETPDDPPRSGDIVQWESQGVLQLAEPRRLTSVSPDGQWAFVEGSPTGLPLAEIKIVRRAAPPHGTPAMSPPAITPQVQPPSALVAPLSPPGVGVKTETFTLERGEIVVRFPSAMTLDDFDNVKAWLDILERKLRKSAESGMAVPPQPVPGHPNAKAVGFNHPTTRAEERESG